ncbi:hypothetical protein IT415_03675 [bacterium]|nr:hypothetical protein [bacterium]
MKPNYFSFRWHHFRRALSKRLKVSRTWLRNYVNRHIYGAWRKLGLMRWQFAAWMAVIVICLGGVWIQYRGLDRLWLHDVPKAGGVYREAIIGRVRQVNPLYIDNSATADVAELVYSRLIRRAPSGVVTPDLAESWTVSADKRTYTFVLRRDVRWHDGERFSAEDVDFTFRTVQSPDARSVLAASWDKVVINAIDEHTVQFQLPASYSDFFSALSQVGILPEHSLRGVKQSQLRLDDFNRRPNGTGPFILEELEANSDVVALRQNPEYFAGEPLLDRIEFRQFDDVQSAIDAYAKQQLDGIANVGADRIDDIEKFAELKVDTYRLPAYVGVYFNASRQGLSETGTRQALGRAIDRNQIVHDILKGQGNAVHYPIPVGYPGFTNQAPRLAYSPDDARAALTNKFSQRLKLVTANAGQYPAVANALSEKWRNVGVPVDVILVDTYTLQQEYIRPRQYDILLYGQDLSGDSDVYSFWHSSQAADPGLNLSVYKNAQADTLLEQARIAKDPAYRDQKYAEWTKLWANDTPALLLYSPYYLYAHTVDLSGVTRGNLSSPSDRLRGVTQWALSTEQAPIKSKK